MAAVRGSGVAELISRIGRLVTGLPAAMARQRLDLKQRERVVAVLVEPQRLAGRRPGTA